MCVGVSHWSQFDRGLLRDYFKPVIRAITSSGHIDRFSLSLSLSLCVCVFGLVRTRAHLIARDEERVRVGFLLGRHPILNRRRLCLGEDRDEVFRVVPPYGLLVNVSGKHVVLESSSFLAELVQQLSSNFGRGTQDDSGRAPSRRSEEPLRSLHQLRHLPPGRRHRSFVSLPRPPRRDLCLISLLSRKSRTRGKYEQEEAESFACFGVELSLLHFLARACFRCIVALRGPPPTHPREPTSLPWSLSSSAGQWESRTGRSQRSSSPFVSGARR